jgi:hypothetical protein
MMYRDSVACIAVRALCPIPVIGTKYRAIMYEIQQKWVLNTQPVYWLQLRCIFTLVIVLLSFAFILMILLCVWGANWRVSNRNRVIVYHSNKGIKK